MSPEELVGYIQDCAQTDLVTKVENVGIGSYEFWGASGVDNQYALKIHTEQIRVEWEDRTGTFMGCWPELVTGTIYGEDDMEAHYRLEVVAFGFENDGKLQFCEYEVEQV